MSFTALRHYKSGDGNPYPAALGEILDMLPWNSAEGVVTEEDIELTQNAVTATAKLYVAMRRKQFIAESAGLLTASLAGQPAYVAKVARLPEVRLVGCYLAAFHPRRHPS